VDDPQASFVSVPPTGTRAPATCRSTPTGRATITRKSVRSQRAPASAADAVNGHIDRGATIDQARQEILFELQIRSATRDRPHRAQHDTMDNPEVRVRAMGEASTPASRRRTTEGSAHRSSA